MNELNDQIKSKSIEDCEEPLFSSFWVFMIKLSTVIIVSASFGFLIGRLSIIL